MKSVINHPALGEISVSQTFRARRISISVRPPDRVCLSLPVGVSVRSAVEFLESKAEWVEQARRKMAARVDRQPIAMPFATRSHTLRLNPAQTLKISVKVAGGLIVITYPADMLYTEPAVQQAIRRGIERAWGIEAKELLPGRLAELSRASGLHFRSVSVRNAVSRWGSCSSGNDISLSLHLMRLPDRLIDYILLHELCHVAHKNHGREFHRLLDRLADGQHAALRRELRNYNPRW
ncbi:MAG: M48 family metallopeptidase [Rikenellaceae bacterium]|jgi:predicted metal-dependent hydrolase|nr:M48 family metallopeptidase [Rikenellaceae bacterium]